MTYEKINLMVPTYKRPKYIARFIRSALKTAINPDALRFTLCVNEKDTDTREWLDAGDFPKLQTCIVTETTDQPNLAMYFNLMYDKTIFNEPDTLISMLGDDMVFNTAGWDAAVLASVNAHGGHSLTYCDDGLCAHESCAVNLFTTRAVVEATGKPFMCERYHADMIDVVWTETARMASILHYLPGICIYHDHHMTKPPGEWDETMKRLVPVRNIANAGDSHEYAHQYATVCAFNMIRNGVGSWNKL